MIRRIVMNAGCTTRCLFLSTVSSIALLLPSNVLAQALDPPGVAPSFVIAAFETDRTGWMPPPRFGETLSELLTARLSSEGVRVIDRGWLAGSSSEVPDTSVARLAGSGVDYIVLGSVTRLSLERHSSSGLGILPAPIVGGLVRRSRTETGISLTVRVVNARTGEILRSVTADGSSDRKQTSGGGLALVGKVPLVGGRRSSATGVHDRLLEEALERAMAVVAAEIVAATAPRGTPAQPELDRF
jgi:curli biogenesis system outer membrane secretion channel CsgG